MKKNKIPERGVKMELGVEEEEQQGEDEDEGWEEREVIGGE